MTDTKSPKVPTESSDALNAVIKEALGDRKFEQDNAQTWRVEAKTGDPNWRLWFGIDNKARTVSRLQTCVRKYDTVAELRQAIAGVEAWIDEQPPEKPIFFTSYENGFGASFYFAGAEESKTED